MKIIALDISQTSTGWSIWHDGRHVATGANAPPFSFRGLLRYRWHVSALSRLWSKFGPFDAAFLEGFPYFLFGMKKGTAAQDNSGIRVGGKATPGRTYEGQGPGNQVFGIAEVTGIMKMLINFKWGIPFANFSPSSIKAYATGHGRARKPDMARALKAEHGLVFKTDDETDAFYIGQLACDVLGLRRLTKEYISAYPFRDRAIKGIKGGGNPEGTLNLTTRAFKR